MNYQPKDKFTPASESRASEIEKRMISLANIKPVLTLSHMVKGWLSRGGLSMLYGPSNAGKTFVALDIAMHIAADQAWRGCRVDGGPVVYIAAEGGAGVLNRLAAFKLASVGMAEAPFILLPIGLDLHGQIDTQAACNAMMHISPALVVVDTLARSMGAGDENTAKDAAMFIRNCDHICRRWGCTHKRGPSMATDRGIYGAPLDATASCLDC